MAVPGFSISELIEATAQVKNVYDAFFSKHASSAARIRDLADDIALFRNNLKLHQEIIESRGLDYDGYRAIERTLAECTDFLQEYSIVLEGRKFSAVGAWKTAVYTYEGDKARRLQERIRSHYHTLHFSMTIMSLKEPSQPSIAPSVPVTIKNVRDKTISPPRSPQFLPDSPQTNLEWRPPLISENRKHSTNFLSQSPNALPTVGSLTPWQTPPEKNIKSRQESLQTSPRSNATVLDGPNDFDLSRQNSAADIVLPQPALSYIVAKLYFDSKMVGLKRKATGRDFDKGRELIIVTESGSPRLNHQIRHPAKQACYPYTWHRRWRDHKLEVTFKGMPVECHSIKINGQHQSLGSKAPFYVFTSREDYVDFQSQVRGKVLVDYFEFGRIKTGSSTKNGEATDQHLKIWRHGITQDYSISFYASAAEKAGDLEFPVSMFNQDFESKDELRVNLDFTISAGSKRIQMKKQSRSGTWTTAASSVASSDMTIFSRTQKGASIAASVATTVTSRTSIGSFGSTDGSPPQTDRSKNGLTELETLGKKMKYLHIEFSDREEALRFQHVFDRVHKEELVRPTDYFDNWRLEAEVAAAGQRESSISNASVPGTPLFCMSPVMASQQSPVLHPQR